MPLRESNKRKSDLFEDWGAEDAEPSEARFKSSRRESVGQPQSDSEAAAYQADVGEYAMFDPFGDVPVGVQLTEGQASFVEKNFTTYLTNDVIMEKILQDCPKPACKFVDPPKLDPSMVALMGVESHKPAKFVDKTFVRIQTKAADVLGPLGALWTKLDEIRRGREEELDVSDLLRLAEKSVMLVGQVYVYATHQRRHAILTRILKDPGSAVEMLKDGEDELLTGLKNGALFGEEFHKLLHHKAKGSKESKEIRQELGRPNPRPRPQTFQPFRQGAPRGFRGASSGFRAASLTPGASAAQEETRPGGYEPFLPLGVESEQKKAGCLHVCPELPDWVSISVQKGGPSGRVVFPPVRQVHSEVLSLELKKCKDGPVTVRQRIVSFQNNWGKITLDPVVLSMVAGLKVDFIEAPAQWAELHWPRFS